MRNLRWAKFSSSTWVHAFAVFAVALIIQLLRHRDAVTLAEPDAFYHVKVAWLMRTQGIANAYPVPDLSSWREVFFDKEFLFHAFLIPFTYGELQRGGILGTCVLGAFVFASFFAALRMLGVSRKHAWVHTAMLCAVSAFFWVRLDSTRPHLVSVALSLLVVGTLLSKRWLATFGLTCLYALSYAAAHVAIGYALIAAFAGLVHERRVEWRGVLSTSVGIALGWLLHPHFPNQLKFLWLQNFGVLSNTWAGSAIVGGPMELLPADTRMWLVSNPGLFLLFFVTLAGLLIRKPVIDDRAITALVVAGVFALTTAMSKRFTEYFIPFSSLAATLLWAAPSSTAIAPWWWQDGRVRLSLKWLGLLTALGLAWRAAKGAGEEFKYLPSPSTAFAAKYLVEHAPAGASVFTCDWDDAPELFFYDHLHRYSVFLDPEFMRSWRPAIFDLWQEVRAGSSQDPASVIEQGFGAKFGYCTADFANLRAQLQRDPRVKITGQQGQPWVFEIATKVTP